MRRCWYVFVLRWSEAVSSALVNVCGRMEMAIAGIQAWLKYPRCGTGRRPIGRSAEEIGPVEDPPGRLTEHHAPEQAPGDPGDPGRHPPHAGAPVVPVISAVLIGVPRSVVVT